MRKAYNGLISSMHLAKERISEHKDMSIETSQTEMQIEKDGEKRNRITKNCGELQMCIICIMGMHEGEERKKQKKHLKK